MTGAILRAYPRARTSWQRENLIGMLAGMIHDWDTEARAFLRQVAHNDDDEDVRIAATEMLRSLWDPQQSPGVGWNDGEFEFDDLDPLWP